MMFGNFVPPWSSSTARTAVPNAESQPPEGPSAMPRHRRHRRPVITVAACALCLTAQGAVAQSTPGVKPLASRDGIVVGYRAQSQTAIVVGRTGTMKSIHALRRYSRGTRVRIRGIKWGSPVAGIKWSRAPLGIKWGIKWALNGTFTSRLDPVGTRPGAIIRGVVIARSRAAVAIATKGGVVTVVVPLAAPAVTGSLVNATAPPATGSVVRVRAAIRDGMLIAANRVRTIKRASVIPVAGSISAIAPVRGTVSIDATSDSILPVDITMAIPSGMDISSLGVGDEVAAVARRVGGALVVKTIGPNRNFAVADNPALQLRDPAAPAGSRPARPATISAINGVVNQVAAAIGSGRISDAAVGAAATAQIGAVRTAARAGDFATAVASLDQFVATIDTGRAAGVVASQTATTLTRSANRLRERLVDPGRR